MLGSGVGWGVLLAGGDRSARRGRGGEGPGGDQRAGERDGGGDQESVVGGVHERVARGAEELVADAAGYVRADLGCGSDGFADEAWRGAR